MHKSEFKLFNYNNYLESSDHDESNDAPVDLDDIGTTIVSGSQDVVMASGVEEDITMSEEPIADLGERFVI